MRHTPGSVRASPKVRPCQRDVDGTNNDSYIDEVARAAVVRGGRAR